MTRRAAQAATADTAAQLQLATREFGAHYEQHAYLVYNLALRIVCERQGAIDAAECAFLSHSPEAPDEPALVEATLSVAMGAAPTKPTPHGAGDPASERLLRLTARLPPPQRTVLALYGLWEAGAAEVGAAMGLSEEFARRLLDSAWQGLAEILECSVDDAEAAYRGWLWAPPPDELWTAVYRGFYRSAEQALRDPADTVVLPAAEVQAAAAGPAAPSGRKRGRRRFGFLVMLALPLLTVAGALAYPNLRRDAAQSPASAAAGPGHVTTTDEPAAPPALPSTDGTDKVQALLDHPHKPLTPQQLDKLRLDELKALRAYSKQQADRTLSNAQREYAARKIGLLRDLAIRRERADRREKELKRQERIQRRRERALAKREAERGRVQVEVQQESTPPSGDSAPEQSQPKNQQDAQQNCLYNADDGTYICQG